MTPSNDNDEDDAWEDFLDDLWLNDMADERVSQAVINVTLDSL